MNENNYTPNQQAYQPPAQQYVQPPVQPYPQQSAFYDSTTSVMSVGQYIGLFILSSIPGINLICWIVWLASPNTNKNKKNYIKAVIVMWVIGLVLTIGAAVLLAAMGYNITEMMNY